MSALNSKAPVSLPPHSATSPGTRLPIDALQISDAKFQRSLRPPGRPRSLWLQMPPFSAKIEPLFVAIDFFDGAPRVGQGHPYPPDRVLWATWARCAAAPSITPASATEQAPSNEPQRRHDQHTRVVRDLRCNLVNDDQRNCSSDRDKDQPAASVTSRLCFGLRRMLDHGQRLWIVPPLDIALVACVRLASAVVARCGAGRRAAEGAGARRLRAMRSVPLDTRMGLVKRPTPFASGWRC